jgi:hypothetical protein
MRAIGGTCATLADSFTVMLANDRVRMYNSKATDAFSAAVAHVGVGTTGWMVISRGWTSTNYDSAHPTVNEPVQRTLQQTIAHEMDHIMGLFHLAGDGGKYSTPNSSACSDVP